MSATITEDITIAASALREGKLVAIPTETVYGLGANALDLDAVAGIFAAKNRPAFDPLIIHQANAEKILCYASEVPAAARKLATACWPGPLTLVLPKAANVPHLVTAGLPTVALRVPAHPLTQQLLSKLDFPVAAPSANPFGYVSPTTAEHVADQLGDKIDVILNGGACEVGLESTIVGFPDGVPTVLRKGGLAVETLSAMLGQPLAVKTHSSSAPAAPGMLSKHYSPGVEMVLLGTKSAVFTPISAADALITFGEYWRPSGSPEYDIYNLSVSGNLKEAAANLFATLRTIAKANYRKVYVNEVPEQGLGRAINDRLRRAAAVE
ncbi:MAG: L-threonylcarbamoyladenylate synthase [Bacteroidota bacterium]